MQKLRPPEERDPAPPKRSRGRPRAFDRDAALEQAMRLFWSKGFEATSIADLTASMRIGAPSLYAAFGSKEMLYAEALRFYEARFGERAWRRFESARTARAAVQRLLMDSAAALTDCTPGATKGCMLTLSSFDAGEHSELCASVRAARGAMFERVAARLGRAVAEREFSPKSNVRALARFIQAVQSGMSILARDGAARAELESVARVAMVTFDARSQREYRKR